jgi:hypothetical protein
MREAIILLGEILLIVLFQTIVETFFEKDKHSVQLKIINIACILGSLYLLLDFAFNNIISELTAFVNLPF